MQYQAEVLGFSSQQQAVKKELLVLQFGRAKRKPLCGNCYLEGARVLQGSEDLVIWLWCSLKIV